MKQYVALSETVSNALVQLDQMTGISMLNAVYALRDRFSGKEFPNNQELTKLAKEYNVTHFFITDKEGHFIRSTNNPLEELKMSLFEYCDGYRGLTYGDSNYEQTPIIPSYPYTGPFKYTMIPDKAQNHIIEASMHLDFIGTTLQKVISADKNIISVGLYTPSGQSLGYLSSEKKNMLNQQNDLGKIENIQNKAFFTDSRMIVYKKVNSQSEQCCECVFKNVANADGGYFYILKTIVSKKPLISSIIEMRNKSMSLFFILVSISLVISYSLSKLLVRKLNYITDCVKNIMKSKNLKSRLTVSGKDEVAILSTKFNEMIKNLEESQKTILEVERARAVVNTARQVAHDIRSPLTALNVVSQHLKNLPEDQRLLIRSAVQRIEDIANDLAGKRRQDEKDAEDKNVLKVQLLSSLIEPLISEKRVQFRSKREINIESDLDNKSYGLFAKIQPVEFKRVLSNLVNNSVEALGENGLVKVSLGSDEGDVKITISDNGNGIPENILPKLMQKGASFGKESSKESGSGLGLYHARESVESWGGKIEIQSEIGKGTDVMIQLPKENPPAWFVSEIRVSEEMQIVILDDDDSIHQVWQGRLDAMGFDKNRILHFTTSQAIISWYQNLDSRLHGNDMLFLCDYELLGNKESGLDVIEQLGIGKSSILVTSRFEEENVKEGCERLGVKLLPKNLAGFVPICHCEGQSPEAILGSPRALGPRDDKRSDAEYVLIDDTHIVRNTWELSAKIAGKKVVTYSCVDEFMKDSEAISKDTSIYIDSDLGDGNRGEVLSEQIYNKGFKKIFLATGFGRNDFKNIPWITAVVDKDPPFLRR